MGKLVSQVKVRWDEDVFHLFLFPYLLSNVSPHIVRSVDLLSGQWGSPGSIILWDCNIDGTNMSVKEIIEAVDKEKKSITYKVVEGDVMKAYNTFKIVVEVESMNEGDNQVTWTIEYEKRSEAVPAPTSFMEVGLAMTKQIEQYIIVPN